MPMLGDVFKRITHQADGYPVPAGPLQDFVAAARNIKQDKNALQFLWNHTENEQDYEFLMDLLSSCAMLEEFLVDKTPDEPDKSKTDQIPTNNVVCPHCGRPQGKLIGEIKMPGYTIGEYVCQYCDYRFEKLNYGDVGKGTPLKPGSLKGGPSEPFTKDPPGEGGRFDECVQEIMSKGKSKESAERICGAINRAKFGSQGP